MLTAAMFFFISQAKPLDVLSAERPHPNIFNVYFFASLLGQFASHISLLIYMYRWAKGGRGGASGSVRGV